MAHPDDVSLMARFVKLLGDRGRLAIVGLLAARPRTGDDLRAEVPSLSADDLNRHLQLLEDAEWVTGDGAGGYRLRSEALAELRAALARAELIPPRPAGESADAMLRALFDKEGRLRALPTQWARRELALRHVAERCFSPGQVYDEREVNERLMPVFEDYLTLRRALLAAGMIEAREGRYWLSPRRREAAYPAARRAE